MDLQGINVHIKNGELENVLKKKKNIWVGVSISMKEYDDFQAQKYIEFASNNSKSQGFVLIADDISAISIAELEHKSYTKSLKLARKRGNVWFDKYRENIDKLNLNDEIRILRWEDVWDDKREKEYHILNEKYKCDENFRERINMPIQTYLQVRKRNVTTRRLWTLSEYILRELPFLLKGIEVDECYGNCLLYPTFNEKTSLSGLVCDIFYLENFKDLREELQIDGSHYIIDSVIN